MNLNFLWGFSRIIDKLISVSVVILLCLSCYSDLINHRLCMLASVAEDSFCACALRSSCVDGDNVYRSKNGDSPIIC